MTPTSRITSFRLGAIGLACGGALAIGFPASPAAAATGTSSALTGISGGAALTPTTRRTSAAKPKQQARSSSRPEKVRTSSTARKRAGAKKRTSAKPRKARPLSEVSVADALALLTPYDGPAGAVIHSKSVTVHFKTTDDPKQQRSFTSTTEAWEEIGGGHRARQLRVLTDADDGSYQESQESWNTDRYRAFSSTRFPRVSVGVFCSSIAPAQEPGQLVREDQANLAALPAGPTIAGRPTRVSVHTLAGGPPDGTPAKFANYLHASSGAPLRTTYTGAYDTKVMWQTDYALWEVQPAGGPADQLAGVIPADAELGDDRQGSPYCIG